jgi:hypothetical protein
VGAGTELDSRTIRDANVVASTGIVLAAHAGAAGPVGLAVGSSAKLDGWTAGDTDVETGAGIVLAVTGGGSGVLSLVITEERKTALVCSVSVVDLFDTYDDLLTMSMWCGTYQLGSRQHGGGADGQSEAQSGREGERLGRHF